MNQDNLKSELYQQALVRQETERRAKSMNAVAGQSVGEKN